MAQRVQQRNQQGQPQVQYTQPQARYIKQILEKIGLQHLPNNPTHVLKNARFQPTENQRNDEATIREIFNLADAPPLQPAGVFQAKTEEQIESERHRRAALEAQESKKIAEI